MSRLEIELTSVREDGTWGWRAAGARQPKGVLDASLLYEGAKVGDVVRADADVEIDGITLLAVYPPRQKSQPANRVEVLGPPPREHEAVTTSFGERRERRDRRSRADAHQGAAADRDGAKRDRVATARPADGARRSRAADQDAIAGAQRKKKRSAETGRQRSEGTGEGARPPRPRDRTQPRRFTPSNTHRKALLASLSPAQVPVAEQLMKGGLPAVRQAVADQNQRARQEKAPEVKADALIAMAEELLPQVRAAAWRDRAEAAANSLTDIALRDLRSVVVGSDAAAKDEDARMLAAKLRETLEARVDKLRKDWGESLSRALDDGRLLKALHLSARPPEPGARLPAELAMRLRDAAGQAMAAETPPDRWLKLLDAVVESPVRRVVKPAALPEEGGTEVTDAARRAAGQVPALAKLLGLPVPPPPGRLGRRPTPPQDTNGDGTHSNGPALRDSPAVSTA